MTEANTTEEKAIETTFNNITISIAAPPARAYELLCNALASIEQHVQSEYDTDTFTTSDDPGNKRVTSDLWPKSEQLPQSNGTAYLQKALTCNDYDGQIAIQRFADAEEQALACAQSAG
jgi:hypothetical protein